MDLLFHYLKPYKWLVLTCLLSVSGFALVELGIPTIVGEMVNHQIGDGDVSFFYQMFFTLLSVSILGVCGTILLGYCNAKLAANISHDIRADVFGKVMQFSAQDYQKFGVGSLITRTNQDVVQIQMFTNSLMRTTVLTIFMFIMSIVMTMRASLTLSFVILATIPFVIIGVFVVSHISKKVSISQQNNLDKMNQLFREHLKGVKMIRSFQKEAYEHQRFEQVNQAYVNDSIVLFRMMSMSTPLFYMLMNIANIAIYMVSMHFISQGNLQLGQLMAFLDYLFHAMISMMLFCSIFMMYPRANVSANRIKEVLHQEIHIQNPSDGKVLEDIEKVAFEHVSFTYEDGEVVLDDISFEAYKGQKVAFLGATGCGKSTLVKLLPRLYDVSSGAIYINDVDVREYDIPSLRQKIGFASQKAVLFSGTVADNVIFGEAGASKADLEKALKQAYAYDFVMDKEGQYEAEVYEGGTNFSGGQKQRLSIARTLIKKAPLYIFDDTFSALDFQSDAKIQKELRKVQNERLTFVVAQRIASVLDADKIIVLDQGKIVDQGSHSELLKRCALYKEIALTQLSEEELYASI